MQRGAAMTWARRLLSIPIVIEAGLLILFVYLLTEALDPAFRGGWMVGATLLLGIGFLGVVFVRDVVVALLHPEGARVAKDSDSPLSLAEDGAAAPARWRTVLEAGGTLAVLFLAIFVFGVVLGVTLTAWGVLIWQSRLDPLRAAIGALLIGVALPVVFARILDLQLWPGLVPVLVPNWIGGGLPPPL
jgi:hypothetical protein